MTASRHVQRNSVREHALRRRALAGVTPALLDRLGPLPDRSLLLDLGCGTGEPALTAARRWPAIRVMGTDRDAAAVQEAQRRSASEGLLNADFVQMAFEDLHLPEGGADAAVSQFGVLQFADNAAVSKLLAREMKPGAPYAFAIWSDIDDNPYLRLGLRAIERTVGSRDVLPPLEPLFRDLKSDATVLGWLEAAGFREVRSDFFEWNPVFDTNAEACHYLLHAGGPFSPVYAGMSDAEHTAVIEALTELIHAEGQTVHGVALPSRCRLISGRR